MSLLARRSIPALVARLAPRAAPSATRSLSASAPSGFIELRQYDVTPAGMGPFMEATGKAAGARRDVFDAPDGSSKWLGYFTTELGGNLNRVHHMYHYESYAARDRTRANAPKNSEWVAYLGQIKPLLVHQTNMTLIEAAPTLAASGLPGIRGFKTASTNKTAVAFELRSYQLKLGYPTVPSFLAHYGDGLPDKLSADGSGASELVTLLYSDCGPLNMVLELWRHESIERSQDSRKASRAALKWKEAVGSIAPLGEHFTTQFLRPAPFSPLQ